MGKSNIKWVFMKFTVSSTVLAQHLSAISGVIARNPIVPILENFLFQVNHNELVITASDLQTSVSIALEIQSAIQVDIAVPARMLLDTVKNLPEQMISLEINPESYVVLIKSDNGLYKLLGENACDFPKFTLEQEGMTLSIPADSFKGVLQQTMFATSQNELKPAMSGVYMDFSPTMATFVATDGHRLVRYIRKDLTMATQHTLIVPKKALLFINSVLSAPKGMLHLTLYRSAIKFQYGHMVIITRLVDERYPDYEAVIPTSYASRLTIDRMALINALRRIMIYANRATHQVKFSVKDNGLTIFAEDLEFSNEANEQLLGLYDGAPLDIGFNAKLLLEMLMSMSVQEVVFAFLEAHKAVLILPKQQADDQDVLLLIMPIIF